MVLSVTNEPAGPATPDDQPTRDRPGASRLPRSSPAGQGVDAARLTAFLDAVDEAGIEMHSLMVLRHGHVVTEGWWAPYSADDLHLLYSLSKSFTSTAVGLAVAEGRLSVDDLATSFFPDSVAADASPYTGQMTVRHLLSMATGHHADTLDRLRIDDFPATFFSLAPEEEPGSWFTYNNGATLLLSAIITAVTGERLLDYLRPRLLAPLGITGAHWRGVGLLDYGFSELHLATEAIAKFGQLYLQHGSWQGEQLVPREWVAEATRVQVDNPREPEIDWRQGYGYQFWMSRHGAYRGDGAYGQFCLVLPDQDAVVAVTAATENMQTLLDCVWSQVLPALHEGALEEDEATAEALKVRLDSLALPTPQGHRYGLALSDVPDTWSVAEPAHERDLRIRIVSIEDHTDGWLVTVADDRQQYVLFCGYQSWAYTDLELKDGVRLQTAASAAWTSPSTFTVELALVQKPHRLTIVCDCDSATTRATWNAAPLGADHLSDLALDPART